MPVGTVVILPDDTVSDAFQNFFEKWNKTIAQAFTAQVPLLTLKGNIMRTTQGMVSPRLLAALLAGSVLAGCSTMGSTASAPATMDNGVLVGPTGMTLYTFDKDAGGKSMCNGKCAENWPPLMAQGTASGDFSIITRDDGSKQYAYKGKPLYYWVKDQKPGDKTGDGVNNVWRVAK